MSGAVPPLPQYAIMAWCSGGAQGHLYLFIIYEGVSKSFRTGRLERELQMVQHSAARCGCIAILWVSLVSFVAITLCVASQRVFVVDFVMTLSGNVWIYTCTA
jgi:membrane protein YqaA with SNARE-associated domain